jgi:hypothetical protein
VKQKRWRIVSSSARYKRQLGRWLVTPGRRGALELRIAPVSSVEELRERERVSGELSVTVRVLWRAWSSFYRPERPGTGVASVGTGAVSVKALVAGMVGRAWAASAGAVVMSVALWCRRVTKKREGSSGGRGGDRR